MNSTELKSFGALMALNDRSLLSAYLDGALDESQRNQVETALREDPDVLLEYQGLAGLQDRLKQLPRPGVPGDLGDIVIGRLREWQDQRQPARLERILARPWLVLAPLGALAAALLVTWLVTTYDHTNPAPAPRIVVTTQPVQVIQPEPPVEIADTDQPIVHSHLTPGIAGISPLIHDLNPSAPSDERLQDLDLLPAGGTLLVTGEPLTLDLIERVDGAVQRAPRVSPHHAAFTAPAASSSTLNDMKPRLVYAVPFDAVEYARFREILKNALEGTNARLIEQNGKAPRVAELSGAKVAFGEVEPSSSLVPLTSPELLGDKISGNTPSTHRKTTVPEPLSLILQDMLLENTTSDHHQDRQRLREILGIGSGQPHDGKHGSTAVYFIEIVEP